MKGRVLSITTFMCILIGLTSSTIYNNDKKADIAYYPIKVVNGDESNNFINTTLYLWGNEGEILNKKLKITAVNNNGERIEISNLYEVTKDGHGEMVEKMFFLQRERI